MSRRKYNTSNERALIITRNAKGNVYFKMAIKEDEVYNLGITDEDIKSANIRLEVVKVERGLLVHVKK